MKKGRIVINTDICKGCDFCITFCPKELIRKEPHSNSSGFYPAVFCDSEKKCNACKICGVVCPEAAIEIFAIVEEENSNIESGKEVADD